MVFLVRCTNNQKFVTTSMNRLKIRPFFYCMFKINWSILLFSLKNSFRTNTTELSPWSGISGEKLTVSRLVKRTSSDKQRNKPHKNSPMRYVQL